ncbi:MAG: type I-U CRISPR-associated helicase/endonuclease Cas3 [Planctomycetota bacterium]|nr:MAG: type I-U CRISPR-associated helicase/endonuclease Cas3 [Planctomycetota bacterium]
MLNAKAITGYLRDALDLPPGASAFPWQQRLLDRFLDGELPRSLDVPTGLGKTASMAIWLLAKAMGAPVPTRLVYVVDRRVVVDQASRVAEGLRDWLLTQATLSERLGLDSEPLPISTLRGQHIDNRNWLNDPSRPAIIVGTVDMIGSRLLFEGYRASRRMRPFMAGLLGHDSLFLLDEAHLVPPFERLLERVIGDRGDLAGSEAFGVVPPPSRLLSLSATGRSRGGEAFDLSKEDLAHPIVSQRLAATKQLKLTELPSGEKLAQAVADAAWRLCTDGSIPLSCIIFLAKRMDAEAAKTQLEKLAGMTGKQKGPPPVETELLVGGRRVHERITASQRLEELGFLAGSSPARACPRFLFATSAGEVGADLDADHMVSDLVAWERMVQRLGRVNRRGEGKATVTVVDDREADDPQAQAVRSLLRRLPAEGPTVDASPGALRQLQLRARADGALREQIALASTPEPLYPPVDLPTVEAWAMTSLPDHSGRPAVEPWLRGWVESRPQTTIAFRARLPAFRGAPFSDTLVGQFFDAAPMHTSEQLEAETSRVADWLKKRAKKLRTLLTKNSVDASSDDALDPACIGFLRKAPGDYTALTLDEIEHAIKSRLERRLDGAELILDQRFAGLSADGLLDESVADLPAVIDIDQGWMIAERPFRVIVLKTGAEVGDDSWRERARFPLQLNESGEVTHWLVVARPIGHYLTEDDRSAASMQLLDEHHAWTADRAKAIAQRLGLAPEASRLLTLAARLHDEGKRMKNWQMAFRAPDAKHAYAKTAGPINQQLLGGYRHEFGSLPYAAKDPELAALDDSARDLVLHLIASHHGFARPIIRSSGDPDSPPSALKKRAREVALRFVRVQASLGPWGLAWWEALVRSADQQASRALEFAGKARESTQ